MPARDPGAWWGSKPPPGVPIDRGSPLARGLTVALALADGSQTTWDSSGNTYHGVLTGGPVWTTGRWGKALSFTAVTQYVLLGAADVLLPTTGVTIVIGSRKRDATLRDSNAFSAEGNRCQIALPYVDGTAYWDFGGATDGVTRVSAAGLTYGDDLWVLTSGPRGMEIWQNGLLRASNTANAVRAAGVATDRFTIGGPAFNVTDLVDVSVFLLYRRQLDKAEVAQVTANPFAMWAPPPYLRATPVAAGGTTFTVALAGTLGASGALTKASTRALAGTLGLAGALTKASTRALSGTLGTAGALQKTGSRALAGTLGAAGGIAASRAVRLVLAGTLGAAGALQKLGQKRLAGTLGAAGALVKQNARALAGTLGAAGALQKTGARALSGTLGTVGALASSRLVRVSLTGTLGLAGALQKLGQKRLGGTLGLAGALAKASTRALSGTLGLAGAVVKLGQKRLAGTLGATGGIASVVTGHTVAVAGTLGLAGAVVKRGLKALAGALAAAGALVKQDRKAAGGALGLAGGLGTAKQLRRAAGGTLGMAGATVTSRRYARSVGGTLGFSGALAQAYTPHPPVVSTTFATGDVLRGGLALGDVNPGGATGVTVGSVPVGDSGRGGVLVGAA